ncbi:hypothetical protein DS891_07110 [Pseudoalteromonas sp. JC28]|uniref:hypothetical protein n=1 Tax=Pseudoalteromonas sp. JC28 TaxID=2267617 RepID=UPI001572D78C|nr:hypothetical protein [Pseudoalteromonas sp. JC28]NSY33367.1 hypothetical protein [Pseudoalteromonas sp. JC28]
MSKKKFKYTIRIDEDANEQFLRFMDGGQYSSTGEMWTTFLKNVVSNVIYVSPQEQALLKEYGGMSDPIKDISTAINDALLDAETNKNKALMKARLESHDNVSFKGERESKAPEYLQPIQEQIYDY